MSLLALDPHPYGCPVCLVATPAQMPETITAIVLKLRDLLFPSVHVINPSKGQSYPILNLHVDEDDDKPRVVLFPAWEDNRESARRRLNYGRQMTLLQRIHDAGVRGEKIEEWKGEPLAGNQDEPLHLAIAATAAEMVSVVHDLQAYLGDQLRMTVTIIEQAGAVDLDIVKVYAPTQEKQPRLVLFPGWSGAVETASDRVGEVEQREILAHIKKHRLKEIPLEALGVGASTARIAGR